MPHQRKMKNWNTEGDSFNLYFKHGFDIGSLRGNQTPTYVTTLRRASTLSPLGATANVP